MSHANAADRIAVIYGIGSHFGADQLGWLAVEWLKGSDLCEHFPELKFKFEQSDRPGSLLLEQLQGADVAIVIDAMQAGRRPGALQAFTPVQMLSQTTGLLSSHGFGLAESVALGFTLGELPSHLSIIGIEMESSMNRALLNEQTKHELLLLVKEVLGQFETTM